MQKRHIKQQWQNVRSTMAPDKDKLFTLMPTPWFKHKDVNLQVFDSTKQTI